MAQTDWTGIYERMFQRSISTKILLCLSVVITTVLLLYTFSVLRNDVILNASTKTERWRHKIDAERQEQTKKRAETDSPKQEPETLPPILSRDIFQYKVMYAASDVRMYMYSSFVDDRVTPNVLRMIGVMHRDTYITDFRCTFHELANNGELRVTWQSRGLWEFIDRSWPDWSPYFAIHIECPLGQGDPEPPTQVLLSYRTVNTNHSITLPVEEAIRVRHRKPLAIVVKPITGQFYVARIVEWIELHRLIGIDCLILYNSDMTGASRYVLDYYQSLGVVHTVMYPYLTSVLEKIEEHAEMTPEDRYAVYQQLYLVALQGAIYRFRNAFRYIAIVDLDEVILPTHQEALLDVIERLSRDHQDGAGFTFPTAWHFEDAGPVNDPDVPPYLYMQTYARASRPDIIQPKSILMTSRTRTVNFHVVVTSLNRSHVTEVPVDWRNYGYVHHYRGRCENKFVSAVCDTIVRNNSIDGVMTRYLGDIKWRVRDVLEHLQLR